MRILSYQEEMNELENGLNELVGKKIVSIEKFDNGSFDSGFLIVLDNGTKIGGQDSEYGDNALYITN